MLKILYLLASIVGVQSIFSSICEHEPVAANEQMHIEYKQTYFLEESFTFDFNNIDYFIHGPELVDGEVVNGCELTCALMSQDCSEFIEPEGVSIDRTTLTVQTDFNLAGEYCVQCVPNSFYNVEGAYNKLYIKVDDAEWIETDTTI